MDYQYGRKIYPKTIEFKYLQKLAVRLITFSLSQTPSLPLFRQLNIFKLNELLYLWNVKLAYRTLKSETPFAVTNALQLKCVSNEIVNRGNTNKMVKDLKSEHQSTAIIKQ